MKLLFQNSLPRPPAPVAECHWWLRFRHDQETQAEADDYAAECLKFPTRKTPPTYTNGATVRRRTTEALLCAGNKIVFSERAVCGHWDNFSREEGRREALKRLLDVIRDEHAGPRYIPAERAALVKQVCQTYWKRYRCTQKKEQLRMAIKLLRDVQLVWEASPAPSEAQRQAEGNLRGDVSRFLRGYQRRKGE